MTAITKKNVLRDVYELLQYILYEILFTSQKLRTWRWCEYL